MTKPPIPTENSKTKGQHTQTPPKTSIIQRLRTDLGRSVGVTSNPTGVVKNNAEMGAEYENWSAMTSAESSQIFQDISVSSK